MTWLKSARVEVKPTTQFAQPPEAKACYIQLKSLFICHLSKLPVKKIFLLFYTILNKNLGGGGSESDNLEKQ